MCRLITILQWIAGSVFVGLFLWMGAFGGAWSAGTSLVMIGSAFAFLILFLRGMDCERGDMRVSAADRAKARRPGRLPAPSAALDPWYQYHIAGASLIVLGGFGLVTGDSMICDESTRYCLAIQEIASRLGIAGAAWIVDWLLLLTGVAVVTRGICVWKRITSAP